VVALYIVAAVFTLVYQIHVRAHECRGFAPCALSFAKGAAWSAIWPVIWTIHMSEMN